MVAVPVNAKLHPRELAFVLGDAEASCLFISDDLASTTISVIEGMPTLRKTLIPGTAEYHALLQSKPISMTHRAPEDPAWLFYTSGTTGNPKGVMETHRNLLGMTSCYFSDVDPVEPDDAIVYAAPMSQARGCTTLPTS